MEPKFDSFQAEAGRPDYIVRFRQVQSLPPVFGKVVYEDMDYRVYRDEAGHYLRSFSDPPRDDTPYAVAAYHYDTGLIQVDYLEKGAHCVSEIGNSFAHLNFEELLLRKSRLCLHASCVDTAFGGILFSGLSGIGKSTQAELWCRHRNAKQINGDRPILSKDGGKWLAWGSPYAGSSRCHINESCAVRAIVMLQKGPACRIRRLPLSEAFRRIWSGLTVHSWDVNFVDTAADLAQELAEAIPVYELICTPDEQAVLCLEDVLRRECEA